MKLLDVEMIIGDKPSQVQTQHLSNQDLMIITDRNWITLVQIHWRAKWMTAGPPWYGFLCGTTEYGQEAVPRGSRERLNINIKEGVYMAAFWTNFGETPAEILFHYKQARTL